MYFYIPDPAVAMIMLVFFLGAVLLGFPIAFTLMAVGIGFGYYAYFDWALMEHLFDNRIFKLFVQNTKNNPPISQKLLREVFEELGIGESNIETIIEAINKKRSQNVKENMVLKIK